MEEFPESDVPPASGWLGGTPQEIRVHVLSETVFCPRAAILALESGQDDGEEEPPLGPRLDGFVDYDEHRFVEELHAAWAAVRLWLTLLAPAALLVLVVWWFVSPIGGLVATLPLLCILAKLWDVSMRIVALVRERAIFAAAAAVTVDLESPQIREVNWWSLRKAGFDCQKPVDPYTDPGQRLVGRPWRVLTKDTTIRIPVIRKHRGERVWRPQHVVRVAAYCQLIRTCEQGDAPFGVLMFAGSYDCLIIPNTAAAQFQFEKALEDTRELLQVYQRGKFVPAEPTGNQCSGCHLGKPREYVAGKTNTILKGEPVAPLRTRSKERLFHCPCGDRFNWVPPHDDSVALGIAQRRG